MICQPVRRCQSRQKRLRARPNPNRIRPAACTQAHRPPSRARPPRRYFPITTPTSPPRSTWVHDHIGEYGGGAISIALLGHSAGADIVANVVTKPAYLQTGGLDLSSIRCAGPLDTEGFDKTVANTTDPDGERKQWKSALGNNPDYVTATSATSQVQPGIGIPSMIGVVRGMPHRQQIETAFLSTLAANGIDATTIDARALTHAEVNANIGKLGDTVMTTPLMAFLTTCLTHKPG